MRASRGMGAIAREKIPKAKKIQRKDDPDVVEVYAKGGPVKGLWNNIHAKRARIKAGSGEKMRKPGTKGAPTAKALRESKSKKG